MRLQDKLIRPKSNSFKMMMEIAKQMPKELKPGEMPFKMLPDYKRIDKFIKTHNLTDKYPVKDLERWHMLLTSSCRHGRSEFAQAHNLNVNEDMMTIPEFFDLVRDEWGSDIIKIVESYMTEGENK